MQFPINLADADPNLSPGRDAVALEQLSRQRLVEWWERLDREPHYPCDDDTAIALCQAVEYSIDREALIRFIDVGAFGGVPVRNGERFWNGSDITRLAVFLECRRDWMPGSELHHAKKTGFEIALEAFRATGEAFEFFTDLETYDLRALVVMLTECDHRQLREAIKVALEIKLESFDIIV
jgi:hypothetical protein